MIIDDLNIVGVPVTPAEANAPLIVDSDAMLPFAITGCSCWMVMMTMMMPVSAFDIMTLVDGSSELDQ